MFYGGFGTRWKSARPIVVEAGLPATGKMELISVGRIVAADVPVLIKSTQGKVVLKLTKEAGTKPEKNNLKGTDTAIESAGAGIKAFTLGQNGVGFYIWEGKPIPANKAYLNVQ